MGLGLLTKSPIRKAQDMKVAIDGLREQIAEDRQRLEQLLDSDADVVDIRVAQERISISELKLDRLLKQQQTQGELVSQELLPKVAERLAASRKVSTKAQAKQDESIRSLAGILAQACSIVVAGELGYPLDLDTMMRHFIQPEHRSKFAAYYQEAKYPSPAPVGLTDALADENAWLQDGHRRLIREALGEVGIDEGHPIYQAAIAHAEKQAGLSARVRANETTRANSKLIAYVAFDSSDKHANGVPFAVSQFDAARDLVRGWIINIAPEGTLHTPEQLALGRKAKSCPHTPSKSCHLSAKIETPNGLRYLKLDVEKYTHGDPLDGVSAIERSEKNGELPTLAALA